MSETLETALRIRLTGWCDHNRRVRPGLSSFIVILTCLCLASRSLPAQNKTTSLTTKIGQRVAAVTESIAYLFEPLSAGDIIPSRELMIISVDVVDSSRATGAGPWSFGTLMGNAAPNGMSATDFVDFFFEEWIRLASNDTADGFNLPRETVGRPDPAAAQERAEALNNIWSSWPRLQNGDLDFNRAPFRLLAIVNRLDIQQGRFVFGFVYPEGATFDPELVVGQPLDGTIIIEYRLPPVGLDGTVQSVGWWAREWHDLSRHWPWSQEYLNALQTLTVRFSGRNVMPERTNGSALISVRTNEQITDNHLGVDTNPLWQLREFRLKPETGLLAETILADTPHFDYEVYPDADSSPSGYHRQILIDYIVANRASLLDGSFELDTAQITPGATSPSKGPSFGWLADATPPQELPAEEWEAIRHSFSERTCSGCHCGDGSAFRERHAIPNSFTHISNRDALTTSHLSEYLKEELKSERIPYLRQLLNAGVSGTVSISPVTGPDH